MIGNQKKRSFGFLQMCIFSLCSGEQVQTLREQLPLILLLPDWPERSNPGNSMFLHNNQTVEKYKK